MVGIFLNSENDVRMVTVQTLEEIIRFVFFSLGKRIINIPVVELWVLGSNNVGLQFSHEDICKKQDWGFPCRIRQFVCRGGV